MRLNKKGFTLVELLVAMSFFSFLLLFVTFGFVQINRSYTRGITVKTIQETARTLVEDISRAVRTTEDFTFIEGDASGGYRLCLSDVRYVWNQHVEDPTPSNNATPSISTETLGGGESFTMIRAKDQKGCTATVDTIDAEEVLDDRAMVQHLSIASIGVSTYKIDVVVSTEEAASTDLDVFGKEAKCKVQIGDQFCDVARFETVVQTRN